MMWIDRKVMLSALLLIATISGYSQDDRYFIYLTDKDNSSFSVENPEEFLSPQAIDRRVAQRIDITTEDLPVNPTYKSEISQIGAEVYYISKWLNGLIVAMDSSELSGVSALSFVDSIAWIGKPKASLSKERSSVSVPDIFESSPYSTASSSLQLGMLNVDNMHEAGYRGEGMTIAVLDGGFIGGASFQPLAHVFTEGHYLGGEDLVTYGANPFRFSGHGTAVWSTIAAKSDSLVGTAYNANFLLYVTEDVASESPIEEYNWLIAAEMADSAGADIIQTSVGYSVFNSPFSNYSYEDLDGKTSIITKAANLSFEKGMIVVTSAGNEGNSSWKYVTAPADSKNVMAVGSITDSYVKSSFSSIGPTIDGRIKPDVVALGSRTTLMAGNGAIQQSSGTSYAAPLIAGLAAGVWQANPDWTNKEVMSALKMTASRALNPDNFYGHGVPNFELAVLGSVLDVSDILAEKVTVYPNPFYQNKIYISLSNQQLTEDLSIRIYDLKGSLMHSEMIAPQGEGIIEMNVDISKKGIYLMTLSTSSFFKEIKLIKE